MKTSSIIYVLFVLIYLPPRLVQLGVIKDAVRDSVCIHSKLVGYIKRALTHYDTHSFEIIAK